MIGNGLFGERPARDVTRDDPSIGTYYGIAGVDWEIFPLRASYCHHGWTVGGWVDGVYILNIPNVRMTFSNWRLTKPRQNPIVVYSVVLRPEELIVVCPSSHSQLAWIVAKQVGVTTESFRRIRGHP